MANGQSKTFDQRKLGIRGKAKTTKGTKENQSNQEKIVDCLRGEHWPQAT